jgi:GTP-binding protein EngB required for normal cell division
MPTFYIIFTGRPNAGKSTTIKALTGLKIPIGKKPGTTTRFNKFQISKDLCVVDMPGYGTKVDATKRWVDSTKNKILGFIERHAENIVVSVHVLNITTFIESERRLAKKGFINLDVEMIHYLRENLGEYPIIAANKIDKGNEGEIVKNLDAFSKCLSKDENQFVLKNIFPMSAKKGIGVGELKKELVSRLNNKGFTNHFQYIR